MAGVFAQIPTISISKQIRPTKIPAGFIWSICFELPEPAAENGYLIQFIYMRQNGTKKNELNETKTLESSINPYWEAWEIKKGEKEPQQKVTTNDFINSLGGTALTGSDYNLPMNDIFFKQYPPKSDVVYTISGIAGFYHGELPADFIVNNPVTGAGPLRSSQKAPPFWVNKGYFRNVMLKFKADPAAADSTKEWRDLSKTTMNDSKYNIDATSWRSWFGL